MEFRGSTKRLPVAEHLTDVEYVQLMETYSEHNRHLWPEDREKYSAGNIVKVERGENGNLHVHYASGDWWHYTKDRKWY